MYRFENSLINFREKYFIGLSLNSNMNCIYLIIMAQYKPLLTYSCYDFITFFLICNAKETKPEKNITMTVVFVWKLKVKKGSFFNFCKEGKASLLFILNTRSFLVITPSFSCNARPFLVNTR